MTIIEVDDLQFTVRESPRRRTLGITVERDGSLTLAAPPGVPREALERFARDARPWLYDKLALKALHNRPASRVEFVSGETVFYLGRGYRLKIVDAADGMPPLRLHQSRFELRRDVQSAGREHFIQWYRNHLPEHLARHLERLTRRVGAVPEQVQVRALGSHWGSCTAHGTLSFHWRVALLPHTMIEYIVAHELVHLVVPSHAPDFWERVERIIPDYQARRQWLAENGARYDL